MSEQHEPRVASDQCAAAAAATRTGRPVLPPVPPPPTVGRLVALTVIRGGSSPYNDEAVALARALTHGALLGLAILAGMSMGRHLTMLELEDR